MRDDRSGQKWTYDEDRLLKKYFSQKKSIRDIASKLNREEDAIVFRLIRLGVLGYEDNSIPENDGYPWYRDEIDQLIQEYDDGLSIQEMAENHKRQRNAILYQLIKQNLFNFTNRKELVKISSQKINHKIETKPTIEYKPKIKKNYQYTNRNSKPITLDDKYIFIGLGIIILAILLFIVYATFSTTTQIEDKFITKTRVLTSSENVSKVETYAEHTLINRTRPRFPVIKGIIYKLFGKEIHCEDGTKIDSCSQEKPLYCTLFGLKEDPSTCGCPVDFRLYDKSCIPEIRCSDGAFDPECSSNKPKQCMNGNLIDNPELCGCPENFKLKDRKCINIRCSDGTVEPDCSSKLKLQCIEGQFLLNPSKCGCPGGYVKRADSCVKICTDGTVYGECSTNKPFYCDNGNLISYASKCGCDEGYFPDSNQCIEETTLIELKIFEYTNDERRSIGLSELRWNNKIAEIARSHSQDMADNHFFDHINLRGEDPTDRARRLGFSQIKQLGGGWYSEGVAENIAKITPGNNIGLGYISDNPDSIAKAIVQIWMNSPGHRANILNSQYSDLGVGVAYDGSYYVCTQNFW